MFRFSHRGDWIFSRTACLGNDAIKNSNLKSALRWNIQKGRVDVLGSNFKLKVKKEIGVPQELFQNEDIWKVSSQILNPVWVKYRPPKLIIFDSFAELTDQLFEYRQISFLSHFGDIKWNYHSSNMIKTLGLLPGENILIEYEKFFTLINGHWGKVPCIYIHFPTKFEPRDDFIRRGEMILEAVKKLQQLFPEIHIIEVPTDLTKLHPEEQRKISPFPYHFDSSTIAYVTNQINEYVSQIKN